jgi:hypothetical protein
MQGLEQQSITFLYDKDCTNNDSQFIPYDKRYEQSKDFIIDHEAPRKNYDIELLLVWACELSIISNGALNEPARNSIMENEGR